MNFKKIVNGSWHSTPHYIHNTSTDTLTTLPAKLYLNETTATVGLKGNTTQTGTPTPDSPIMPQGTGDMSNNLFDAATAYGDMYDSSTGVLVGAAITLTAMRNKFTSSMVGVPITISIRADDVPVTRVYIRCTIGGTNIDSNRIAYGHTGTMTVTVTPTSANDDWRITFGTGSGNLTLSKIMLNEGSTALPYEPYGIKIPISSANTTTPVYLGEVETTRKVKKVVFNGSEPWILSGNIVYINNTDTMKLSPLICTHFPNVQNTGMWNSNNWIFRVNISNLGMSGRDAWLSYLQQQYVAGTPVTVWYVLATEETAVVNEPLMKIGDYADTLSNVSIPVTAGGDTLSVGTTVQPSEVTVNYKGWHPVQNVHERDNGAWT